MPSPVVKPRLKNLPLKVAPVAIIPAIIIPMTMQSDPKTNSEI